MTRRYYVETRIAGDRAILLGTEAHHLAHVMRARPGDRVTLFDGGGAEFAAEVAAIGRDRVELTIVGRDEVDRELPFRLTLAVALPKGERQRWLVEKAVELGVAQFIPLATARSVARPGAGVIHRMTRWVIDASKQCGRNRLMEIAEPMSWPELLAGSADVSLRILAHPGLQDASFPATFDAARLGHGEAVAQQNRPPDVLAAIGPEGGFTNDELAAAHGAGWRTVYLGPRILRTETAAVLLAAMLAARLETEPRP